MSLRFVGGSPLDDKRSSDLSVPSGGRDPRIVAATASGTEWPSISFKI